ESLIDRVNTTGTVFLGLTINCCQCHDHKYDPLTQRDYYRLYAFFNNTDDVVLDLTPPADAARRDALRGRVAVLGDRAPGRRALTAWLGLLCATQMPPKARRQLLAALLQPANLRDKAQRKLLDNYCIGRDAGFRRLLLEISGLNKQEPPTATTL